MTNARVQMTSTKTKGRWQMPTQVEGSELLLNAAQAALRAGDEIMAVYETDFSVDFKEDESPLTLADTRSHDRIMEQLEAIGIPILSEEGRDIPYGQRSGWQRLWIVDPLDGTKEFVKRRGEFTVNIALVENGRPRMGIIYVPVKKALYFGERSIGSYKLTDETGLSNLRRAAPRHLDAALLKDISARGRQLPIRQQRSAALAIVGSRSHGGEALQEYVEAKRREAGEVDFVSAGSSLKFCLVAEGIADLYPRLGPTMEWDTAAGQAIAENAGAVVLEYETGKPLAYNRENLLNPWFIVKRQ
jgi:3'(2'), 5'-bisphosphate nucleotidase